MDNENKNLKSDDLRKTQQISTWAIGGNPDNSQIISEILRAATGDKDGESGEKSVSFYLANEPQPIEFSGQGVIRIGRMVEIGSNDMLNLHNYHGAVLGVSRYHAEIVLKDGAYYIKDMGSTNGTWVNNEKIPPYRLKPLHDSDQLRFGHFNIVVKFSN